MSSSNGKGVAVNDWAFWRQGDLWTKPALQTKPSTHTPTLLTTEHTSPSQHHLSPLNPGWPLPRATDARSLQRESDSEITLLYQESLPRRLLGGRGGTGLCQGSPEAVRGHPRHRRTQRWGGSCTVAKGPRALTPPCLCSHLLLTHSSKALFTCSNLWEEGRASQNESLLFLTVHCSIS